MLPVPDASLLAVEICSETSAAAKIHLSVGYTIVLDEYNFQLAIDGSIVVYNICYGVDEFDDLLGTLRNLRMLFAPKMNVLG